MRPVFALCAVLLVACAPPPSAPHALGGPLIGALPPSEFEEDGGPDGALLPRAERTFEAAPVVVVAAPAPPAYRNPRYLSICRRDNRRGDGPVAERVEVKREARDRARAMARAGELDEALIFTRMAYGEEGTPTRDNSDGYEAMLAVIDFQRGGMSRVEMMVNYAPRRVFPLDGESRAAVRQQWVAELQLNGVRPPSWPAHRGARWHVYPPWRTYGCPRWLATVDAVRLLLRRYEDRPVGRGPCEEVPHHWGGSMDAHEGDCRWRVVDCGNTADTFWAIDALCSRVAS